MSQLGEPYHERKLDERTVARDYATPYGLVTEVVDLETGVAQIRTPGGQVIAERHEPTLKRQAPSYKPPTIPLLAKPLVKRAQESLTEEQLKAVNNLADGVVQGIRKALEELREEGYAVGVYNGQLVKAPIEKRKEDDEEMNPEQLAQLRKDLLRALTNPQRVREELEREEREELFKSMQPPEWQALKQRKEQEALEEQSRRAENRKAAMDALGITTDLARKQATAAALTNAMLENARKSERPLDIHDVAKLYATIDRLPYQKVRDALLKKLNTALSQTPEGLEIWRTVKYKELTAQAETMPMGEIEQMIDKVEQQFSRR
ncbi:hypothetical protein Tfer_2039 [Thermincola ferriacetica]|uniref:Uncharacterized protein n=1 Tax=Thermincola ferriacetica TaxID=281456 RepID=A0A0L6W1H8_9FIRM|nr:hypothetical protein [Thermincola ferriacetica]KNZ69400.1 hypothetical protein Tfer_2039 [Thermincola ferriacetica]